MSLDVYLEAKETLLAMPKIPYRENGQIVMLSREEWNERFPNREPITIPMHETNCVYHANITHNLNKMAAEAGIYKCLWQPEEIGITKAEQLIEPLSLGRGQLLENPEHFAQFNPENGWGSYNGLVQFVERYLIACKQFPDATVRVSR